MFHPKILITMFKGFLDNVYNGHAHALDGTITKVNAHLTYKGRSIVVDYEKVLHPYSQAVMDSEKYVPFEVYPYGGDIYMDYAPTESEFRNVDLFELLKLVDKALEFEPTPSQD